MVFAYTRFRIDFKIRGKKLQIDELYVWRGKCAFEIIGIT